ncbi:MAG: galactose-1-phosphate uridyl transferase [Watsoniomyces obsoletus]|nr:MAG: galactose-1-phosphate uridyl transferase [Watsoniomyces obsoletus]
MPNQILNDISHRRYNPLRGSWVLVSPHRTKRPWQGQQEATSTSELPVHDPACYLCPGNKRAQGQTNPKYEHTFIFVNDYSAVKEDQAEFKPNDEQGAALHLLRVEPVTGRCYVLAFSPFHNMTLADMSTVEILLVVFAWTRLYSAYVSPSSPLATLAQQVISDHGLLENVPSMSNTQYRYMQIFENKGAAMGCSNPHPHGQIWITSGLPEEPSLELGQLQKYRQEHRGAHLLQDYAQLEIEKNERVVYENDTFLAVCPWWAIWPFEVMIMSKTHKRALVDLNDLERGHLADVIADVTRRYDNLFETQFPYSMGIHQAPLSGTKEEIETSYLHIHFYPPLLRSATVRKFLVGYEMMAEPQRDITPEQAAQRLRDCGGELYRKRGSNASESEMEESE